MRRRVFVYGTLEIPEVVRALMAKLGAGEEVPIRVFLSPFMAGQARVMGQRALSCPPFLVEQLVDAVLCLVCGVPVGRTKRQLSMHYYNRHPSVEAEARPSVEDCVHVRAFSMGYHRGLVRHVEQEAGAPLEGNKRPREQRASEGRKRRRVSAEEDSHDTSE